MSAGSLFITHIWRCTLGVGRGDDDSIQRLSLRFSFTHCFHSPLRHHTQLSIISATQFPILQANDTKSITAYFLTSTVVDLATRLTRHPISAHAVLKRPINNLVIRCVRHCSSIPGRKLHTALVHRCMYHQHRRPDHRVRSAHVADTVESCGVCGGEG